MNNARSSTPFMETVFKFLGYIAILVGAIWFIYKKITFDKSGEYVYDQELKDKIEQAKQKGMDKLNIISEQIEKVEPVVLNGIAHVDNDLVSAISIGKLGALFQTLFKFILSFDKTRFIKSKKGETYKKGNTCICKLTIRGKTLNAYLGLDPKAYENTKYVFTDVSQSKTYANYPMRVKLTSNRQVRWLKELLSDLLGVEGSAK